MLSEAPSIKPLIIFSMAVEGSVCLMIYEAKGEKV